VVVSKSDSAYILGAAFTALTNLFYCCTLWFPIKLPRYYPLEHTWKWVNEKGVPSQGWYGMQVFAFLTAGAVTLMAYFVLKRVVSSQASFKPAQIRTCGVITTLIVVVCMGYMLYYEFNRWGIFRSMGL
jgi:hypothetical protein